MTRPQRVAHRVVEAQQLVLDPGVVEHDVPGRAAGLAAAAEVDRGRGLGFELEQAVAAHVHQLAERRRLEAAADVAEQGDAGPQLPEHPELGARAPEVLVVALVAVAAGSHRRSAGRRRRPARRRSAPGRAAARGGPRRRGRRCCERVSPRAVRSPRWPPTLRKRSSSSEPSAGLRPTVSRWRRPSELRLALVAHVRARNRWRAGRGPGRWGGRGACTPRSCRCRAGFRRPAGSWCGWRAGRGRSRASGPRDDVGRRGGAGRARAAPW